MTHLDLATWINDTAIDILGELPLQSLDSAASQAYLYLSNVGGWVPDDILSPTGPGLPFNGFTPQQAADAISDEAFASVYDIGYNVIITLGVQGIAKYTTGLTLDVAAASMASQISNFITSEINNSPIPLRIASIGTQSTVSSRSALGGITDQTVRQDIYTEIISGSKIIDYKITAIVYLQNTYGIDDTWNVFSIYTEADKPITVMIRKYTDTTFSTLDSSNTRLYVINVSPVTYDVVTGAIIG